jgi:thiol-disulfide isomerase/thioredoxin
MRNASLALYLALTLTANAGHAQGLADDWTAVEALRAGDMEKLVFLAEPIPVSETAFLDAGGTEVTFADYEGQWIVLNFWATWCAPCREEMPTLSALQTALGGDTLQVVTIATGRNDPVAITQFFADIGVDNLPLSTDPQSRLARDFGVLGLPATIIIDPSGREVARLLGDADWASENALAVLTALVQS